MFSIACLFLLCITLRANGLLTRGVLSNRQRLLSLSRFSYSQNNDIDRSIRDVFTSDKRVFLQKSFTFASTFAAILLPSRVSAVEFTLPQDCSDSLTVFQGKGRQIVMIGTAHISEESANLVRRTIQKLRPDIVMIELDSKRIGRIEPGKTLSDFGFIVPRDGTIVELTTEVANPNAAYLKRPPSTVSGFSGMVNGWIQNVTGAVLGKALQQFYQSIEKLGFVAGGEFKAAVQEGRAVGASILLGDRDVDITLQHLAKALSDSDPNGFDRIVTKLETMEKELGIDLDKNQGEIDKVMLTSFVESVKTRETLNVLIDTLRYELPLVYAAMIGERDAFMSDAILNCEGNVIVGVVGMAHLRGIETILQRNGYKISQSNCPPR